jgi:excisionase family DNA binding protein
MRNAECRVQSAEWKAEGGGRSARSCEEREGGQPVLVTRRGLAVVLGVSLRTVDRMLAAREIAPVRLRGWSVRFYVPDVVRALTATALSRKHGRNCHERTQQNA